MDKLRPVKDVWDELSEVATTDEDALGIIQAEREATVVRVWDIVKPIITPHFSDQGVVRTKNAILAVAQPPEDPRERLARKLWEADMVQNIGHTPGRHTPWEKIGDDKRIEWRNIAAVAITELDKIKEEQKL